ncbi:hypothetical protein V6N13_091271 [Hibiscus sabdariffa]
MTPEARARVLQAPCLERPRQQRGPRSTGASSGSRQQIGRPSTSTAHGLAAKGPSNEPYTPMPPVFSHASSSQFQSPMAPPTEGFFVGAFQPYNSMMTAPLHSPTHQLHTSMVPVSVYPPYFSNLGGSSYVMVQYTPPGSLFATGLSGNGHHATDETEDDDDDNALVRRNPPQKPSCTRLWIGGHRGH